jgi:hypothetical protein
MLGTINSTQAYQKCYDSSENFSVLGTPKSLFFGMLGTIKTLIGGFC